MATRHQAREVVISMLYANEVGNEDALKFLDEVLEERKIRNRQKEFTKELLNGVRENLEDIDNEIKRHLDKWDFQRVGAVEKAILRLGTYEILFSNLDKAIIINEAIELTKKLASEKSPKFINGVLDSIEERNK